MHAADREHEMSLVTPPAGWQADVAQATQLTEKANAVSHYGAERALAASEVYVAPTPGAALFVTAIAAKVTTDREVAARMAVDELHATTQRAALAGTGIVEDAWQERVDAAGKLVEATLTWRDTTSGTITHARLVIAADGENLIAVTGECVGTREFQFSPCENALRTLDPGIALDKRVALSLAPIGTQAPPREKPATMSDGSRTPMPPMTLPTENRTTDRRPVYVGAGLVVLAAAFWWKQRRKKESQ
jgi:hypothetical protein